MGKSDREYLDEILPAKPGYGRESWEGIPAEQKVDRQGNPIPYKKKKKAKDE